MNWLVCSQVYVKIQVPTTDCSVSQRERAKKVSKQVDNQNNINDYRYALVAKDSPQLSNFLTRTKVIDKINSMLTEIKNVTYDITSVKVLKGCGN